MVETLSVSIDPYQKTWLKWHRRLNASMIVREHLDSVMEEHEANPEECKQLHQRAVANGYDADEVVEEFSTFNELQQALEAESANEISDPEEDH